MAQWYANGAANIFAAVGTSGFAYLGTTEAGVDAAFQPIFEDVPNDLTGGPGGQPIDVQFLGETVLISGVLTRWNEAALLLCQSRTYRGVAGRGQQGFGAIGAFMALENHGFALCVTAPYVTKPQMRAGGLPPCYRLPAAYAAGESIRLGTRAKRVAFQFRAFPLFAPINGGSSLLYDHVLPALPPID
jgi:hypothetical protein